MNKNVNDLSYNLIKEIEGNVSKIIEVLDLEYESLVRNFKKLSKTKKNLVLEFTINKLLEELKKNKEYQIIVRPHPQHVRLMKDKFIQLEEKYKENKNIIIQTDFSSNDTVFNADILITDWSSIAYEYCFSTRKPVIFIDTPMKIMNPEYQKIAIEPFNIWARNEVGKVVTIDKINTVNKILDDMLKNPLKYQKKIEQLREKALYNIGTSHEVAANYIISSIQKKIKERKENEK